MYMYLYMYKYVCNVGSSEAGIQWIGQRSGSLAIAWPYAKMRQGGAPVMSWLMNPIIELDYIS